MFGTLKGRLLIIAAVVIASAATLYFRGITRGLDLSGGIYLALEVADPDGTMTPEVRREHTDRNIHILRSRIDPTGTGEQNVQRVGDYRIIVELPGETDIERARQLISQTAFLEFKAVADLAPLVNVLPRMDRAVLAAMPEAGADTTRGMQRDVRERIFGAQGTADTASADSAAADTTGADPAADTTADTAAAADLDAPAASNPLSELLLAAGDGEMQVAEQDVDRVTQYLALPGVSNLLPRGTELVWGARQQALGAQLYRSLYLLESDPFITGERLENATAARDPQFNQTVVGFEFDRRGGRTFSDVTSRSIGKRIAIVLDDEVHSAPVVQSQIGSSGQIEMGQAPMEEARDLALVLRAGAFSAPLAEVENRSIGPSLGQDSIDQGQIAGMIGIALVIMIMIGYYRMAGVLAVTALVVYVLLLLAGLSMLGAALTAPGIAGMILSLGMAVDANVLIFERIREELAGGRTVRAAVDNGFQHAMSAIVDSNITTLITALILFQVGTGPVRGFAVTLSIGIIASFFSAVFITRTFFLLYLERRRTADAISI
jgi:preprotein translocase subunit SecD